MTKVVDFPSSNCSQLSSDYHQISLLFELPGLEQIQSGCALSRKYVFYHFQLTIAVLEFVSFKLTC